MTTYASRSSVIPLLLWQIQIRFFAFTDNMLCFIQWKRYFILPEVLFLHNFHHCFVTIFPCRNNYKIPNCTQVVTIIDTHLGVISMFPSFKTPQIILYRKPFHFFFIRYIQRMLWMTILGYATHKPLG